MATRLVDDGFFMSYRSIKSIFVSYLVEMQKQKLLGKYVQYTDM